MSLSFLHPLYKAVAWLLVHIQEGMAPIFGASSGWSWAVSIILLTAGMRLILVPLFVKQIRSQRAMQVLQPQIKALQAKYKNDKEKLNQEMMALWREAGVNPLSGCLPLLLQMPIFIALWEVLDKIKPDNSGAYHLIGGVGATFPLDKIKEAANAKIFGVPIAAAFNSSHHTLDLLNASPTSTKVLAGVLTVVMVVTTFITQRQLMARRKTADGSGSDQMAQTQKILLYVFPLFFLIYGYRFPLGVLLYWLTSNLWSMGQQLIVIRRMEAEPAGAATAASAPAGPAPGAKPKVPPRSPASKPGPNGAVGATPPKQQPPRQPKGSDVVLPPGGAIAPSPRPSGQPAKSGGGPSKNARRPSGRSNKRKRRGRR